MWYKFDNVSNREQTGSNQEGRLLEPRYLTTYLDQTGNKQDQTKKEEATRTSKR